jgi:hypothetical protein
VKIPKSVNTALDWAGHNGRAVVAVVTTLIVAISVAWAPLLAAFVLGIAIGGFAVHLRMAPRQKALRTDIDDLLRQNGALRREKLRLASGVLTRQGQLTHKLPVIPDDDSDQGDTEVAGASSGELVSGLVPRLVDGQIVSAGELDRRQQAPTLVGDLRRDLDALAA